ncbi:MAG: cupin domain-containing protein [bacterium]
MRLPRHSIPVLALAGVAIVLGVWPRTRSSPASPPTTAAGGVKVATIAQTTRTVADQRIEFPRYRNQFTAVLTEIGAGGQTGRYKHLVPSFVYVLDGTLTFEVEGHGTRMFSAGQGFAAGVNVWHNARNRTNRPVRILIIHVGNDQQRVNLSQSDEAARQQLSPFDFVVGPYGPGEREPPASP